MTVLEFILGVIIVVLAFLLILGLIGFKYNTEELEEENERLKMELRKARSTISKREYKKAKEVKKC